MAHAGNTDGRAPGAGGPAILVEGVRKRFGDVEALKGVDLQVPPASLFALLGPNGAGKTTLIRILTTLLKPDEGRAMVAGYDVARDEGAVRSVIGLAGQYAAVDANLTGRENLEMVGRLYHIGRARARQRAEELLRQFDLIEAANRRAGTYSGGMRRRLDLAASLVASPKVLFLDEPTTGLDPRSRIGLWDVIQDLVRDGTTVMLTTQYLEEADYLAERIGVIDHGELIAEGTSDELKAQMGGDVILVRLADRQRAAEAASAVEDLGSGAPQVDDSLGQLSLPVSGGPAVLAEVVRRLDARDIVIAGISLGQPSLDDVFLALTGHAAEEDSENGDEQGRSPASQAKQRGR